MTAAPDPFFDALARSRPDPFLDALMRARPGDDAGGLFVTIADLLGRPEWHQRATCRGMGPAVFYADGGARCDEARAVCARCPVAGECSEAGQDDPHGTWGGVGARERRLVRSSGRLAPPAA